MGLPKKLKLKIYEDAVIQEEPIAFTLKSEILDTTALRHWYSAAAIAQRTQPALSYVCKEMRDDVLDIYYKRNRFEAGCRAMARRAGFDTYMVWLECIGSFNRELLRDFTVRHGAHDIGDQCYVTLLEEAKFEMLDRSVGLRRVRFPQQQKRG